MASISSKCWDEEKQHLQPALHMPEPLSITYKYELSYAAVRVTEAHVILLTSAAMSSSIAIQMYQKLNSSWESWNEQFNPSNPTFIYMKRSAVVKQYCELRVIVASPGQRGPDTKSE